MKEAMFWRTLERGSVECGLCRHRCRVSEGDRGICGVRENRGGKLYTLVYGRATAMAFDAIEKKPLYHFMPGSVSFSIATKGCNFRCLHCQNCGISQPPPGHHFADDRLLEPSQVVRLARAQGCGSISYTYTEPTIFFEYAYDTARAAKGAGLKNVFVTNGYITPEALRTIRPYLDAANIDLKAFREDTYRRLCGAGLASVLDTIELYRELGIWIEVTTLVIPGWTDSDEELAQIAGFVAGIGPEVPWHVSRFSPTHKLTEAPPTPVATLKKAREIGEKAGLRYVYIGNLPDRSGARTYCPECGKTVIDRSGRGLAAAHPPSPVCPECGYLIEGVWEQER